MVTTMSVNVRMMKLLSLVATNAAISFSLGKVGVLRGATLDFAITNLFSTQKGNGSISLGVCISRML